MNDSGTLQTLREELAAAQQRREEAGRRLDEALLNSRVTNEYEDSLESAKREWRKTRPQVTDALIRVSNLMIHVARDQNDQHPRAEMTAISPAASLSNGASARL
jgi:hypothetical protein